MLRVSVRDNDIRVGDRFSVSFQRTLRIPDDGKSYPLPPGLGKFPIHWAQDDLSQGSSPSRRPYTFIMPMYQREALWLGFNGPTWRPHAVKVGVGGINAISGEEWKEGLRAEPQDYLVAPPQLWLDGINVGPGRIRQFVAVPLGSGYSIESQLRGTDAIGGLQVIVFEPKPGRFLEHPPAEPDAPRMHGAMRGPPGQLGLGAGGVLQQKIYADPFGVETWDLGNFCAVFIHIVNTDQYRALTGLEPPSTPISAQTYTELGLPWFSLYDEDRAAIGASGTLTAVRSVRDLDEEKGGPPRSEDESVTVRDADVQTLPLPPDTDTQSPEDTQET